MRMQPTNRKVRVSKKFKLYIRRTQEHIKELRRTYHPDDLRVANLLDEWIAMGLLQYNSPGYSTGYQKAKLRIDQIIKEINIIADERTKQEQNDPTKFYQEALSRITDSSVTANQD